jgi:short-subunit dehydrogenase
MSDRWLRYYKGKRVCITGASSGIGLEMTRLLAEAGVSVLGAARRKERLDQLSAEYPTVVTEPVDLEKHDELAEFATRAWDRLGGIDVLINNAGFSQRSAFLDTDPIVLDRVINVNVLGTVRLTQAVARRMKAQGGGQIGVVTSVAARLASKRRTGYSAAKAALHRFFDAARMELAGDNITVSVAAPGYVRTEISHHAVTASGDEHGVMDKNQEHGASARSCAREILRGFARQKREFYVSLTPKLRLGLFLQSVFPGVYFWAMRATE